MCAGLSAKLVGRAWLAVLTLGLAGCAEGMFFHPDQIEYTTPAKLGLQAQRVRLTGPRSSELDALWLPAQGTARGTVLQVHGNAANLSNHLPLVSWLPAAGYNVLAFDYRGYGASTGTPSLGGIVDDTLSAMAWLRARPDVGAQGFVVLGHSLGGATATRAVTRSPEGVRLLVLDSPLSSYRGMAADAARRAAWPVRLLAPLATLDLPTAQDDPLQAIPHLAVPLLVLVGLDDRVVPPTRGEALWAAAPQPKTLRRIEGGQHIDALGRADVRELLMKHLKAAAQPHPPEPARTP